mmetsp:Transcript_5662/g.12341  ORF Transcript_5662/g.12341 Transcript_5662/m.12341 type:complete len:1047 (-) Transcript_5662:28-3168(-)
MPEPHQLSDTGMPVGNNLQSSAIPSSSKNFGVEISHGALLSSRGREDDENLATSDLIQGPRKQNLQQQEKSLRDFNLINQNNDGNKQFNSTQTESSFKDTFSNNTISTSIYREDIGPMNFTHARGQLPYAANDNRACCIQTTDDINGLDDQILQLRRQLRCDEQINPTENQPLSSCSGNNRKTDLFRFNGINGSENENFLMGENSVWGNNNGQTQLIMEQKQRYQNFYHPQIYTDIELNERNNSVNMNSLPPQSIRRTNYTFRNNNYCNFSATSSPRGNYTHSTLPAINSNSIENYQAENTISVSERASTMMCGMNLSGIGSGLGENDRYLGTNQLGSEKNSRQIVITTSNELVDVNRGELGTNFNQIEYSQYGCAGNRAINRRHNGSKAFQNQNDISQINNSCDTNQSVQRGSSAGSMVMAPVSCNDNHINGLGRNCHGGNENMGSQTNFLNATNAKGPSETKTLPQPSKKASSMTKQPILSSTNDAATIPDHVWRCRICYDPNLVFHSFEEMRDHHKVCTKSKKRMQGKDEKALVSSPHMEVFDIGTNSNDMTGKIIFRDDNNMIPPSPLWGPEIMMWNQQAVECPESVGSRRTRNSIPGFIVENNADNINGLYPPRPPFAAGEQTMSANFQSWLKQAKSSSSTVDSCSKENPTKKPRTGEADQTPQVVASTPCDPADFAPMEKPMPLSLNDDSSWVTPLHCFVRKNFVEVFTASANDVKIPSKGKRRQTKKHQVGIRCPHCRDLKKNTTEGTSESNGAVIGSVYYPNSIAHIYNATMNLLQRHLQKCPNIPKELLERYSLLKSDDARSATSKKYWIDSARSLGLVDTSEGIRYAPSHATVSTEIDDTTNSFSGEANALSKEGDYARGERGASLPSNFETFDRKDASPLVNGTDIKLSTKYAHFIMQQMQRCVFSDADRLGKRKDFQAGFAGLACRHCFGGYGSGRFFPSSIKTLSDTSKTLNVLYAHLLRCRKCPVEVKEKLTEHKKTHDSERQKMRFGSQKEFFSLVWKRLHGSLPPANESIFIKRNNDNGIFTEGSKQRAL